MSLVGPRECLAVRAPLCLIYIAARICDFHYACDQLRFYLSNSHLYFISCGTQLTASHYKVVLFARISSDGIRKFESYLAKGLKIFFLSVLIKENRTKTGSQRGQARKL